MLGQIDEAYNKSEAPTWDKLDEPGPFSPLCASLRPLPARTKRHVPAGVQILAAKDAKLRDAEIRKEDFGYIESL